MSIIIRTVFTLSLSLLLFGAALAQTPVQTRPTTETQPPNIQRPTPVVTATAGNHQVRYVAVGEVHHTRLQVFSSDGTEVFDSDFRLGNLIDWQLRDQQGLPLTDGSYLFLVTVKDFSARLTQKYGIAVLGTEQVYLEQTNREALPQAQATALESGRQAEVLSPVDRIGAASLNRTNTIAASDGNPTSVTQPTGIVENIGVPPGGANIAGTGSTNKIAKWTDNAGTLGDSAITETGGLTVFGQAAPLFPSAPSFHVVEIAAPGAKSPLVLAGGSGVMEFWKELGGGTGAITRAVGFGMAKPGTVASDDMVFSTFASGSTWFERMRITNTGNVGIGTATPVSRLTVAGDISVTGNAIISGNIAAKYQDLAEWVPSRHHIVAGTVVILDVTLNNAVTPSYRSYDTHIAGVVSAQPGVILGEGGDGKVLVATTGRVKVKVDASRHRIKIGDLLVTSGKPGVAMRSRPLKVGRTRIHRPGTIIGKALEPLAKGEGEILVLLSLQ